MKQRIIDHLSQDPRLKEVLDTLTLPPLQGRTLDVYASLVRTIISQQLSGKAANTIYHRFLNLFPAQDPTPARVLAMTPEQLRSAGLSRQKSGYVQNIARFFHEERRQHTSWADMKDEDIIRMLLQIKGVGPWTVDMILIFTLRRPDVLPLGDLGIRNAMTKLYNVEEDLSSKQLKEVLTSIAEPWRPYRSYACRYLWRWLDQ